MGLAARRNTPPLVVLWVALAALVAYLVGGWWLVVPLLGAVGWFGWTRWQRADAQSTVQRWNRRNARNQGMASRWALLWHLGAWRAKLKASVLRPTFANLTRFERWATSALAYAVPICRVGSWIRLWIPIENMICVFGRPRSGKTAQLIHWILDWAGPLIVTSTKVDIYTLTRGLRRRRGPVLVFNPTGLGDLPNTLFFNPLIGCEDAERAEERAIDMISGGIGSHGGDSKRWDDQAQRVLTGLLHAAALGDRTMVDVLRWVSQPDESAPEVMALLRGSLSAYAFIPSAKQFFDTNSRTRSSVTFTIMPALAWLSSTKALAATQGGAPFDVQQLLSEHTTLYMFAESGRLGPLLSALAGYIAREAKRIAARSGGRLDPALRMVLDELANICGVPLPEWSSDFGSHGIQIIAAFQSRAQMVGRWGEAGARAIANNTAATILHAYGQDTDDLKHWVTLAGERDELTAKGIRRVPVVTLSQLREMPAGTMAVYPPATAVTIGRMSPGWKRRDLRAQAKLERLDLARLFESVEEELAGTAEELDAAAAAGSPIGAVTRS